MRLYEIIDFKSRDTIQDVSSNGRGARLSKNTKSKEIGNGIFSNVNSYDSPKRLNQVTKISIPNWYDKGYISYLKMVYDFEQHGGQNPYFPRIHDLKIYKDNYEKLQFNVKLEKLYPYDTTYKIINNEELMKSLTYNMFGVNEEVDITSYLNYYLTHGGTGIYIKDKKLKEALDMIMLINKNSPHTRIDMHDGNIMWRITGTMPQLVITDPLA